jgi:hypothetical protein
MSTIVDLSDRRDSRGLPEGYDPHKLYEYRYNLLQENASPLEKFLYAYIPFELIRSFAIAIDPTAPFKVSSIPITPANRTKYRAVLSVLQERAVRYTRVVNNYAPEPNYLGIGGCTTPWPLRTGFNSEYVQGLQRQEPLPDELHDTTSRTRLIGSKQGTLTKLKGYSNSPSRSCRILLTNDQKYTGSAPSTDPCIIAGGAKDYHSWSNDTYHAQIEGSGARLSSLTHSSLMIHEQNYNIGLMQTNAVAMLKGWTPFRREYTFFRNLVELRDLPSSISSLKSSMQNFRKLYVSLSKSPSTRKIIFDLKKTSKDIPNEYLSYHFGWKQLYKDVTDLLNAPAKVTKKINFLIARSGQPTTFRTKRQFVSGESGVSGYDYETLNYEYIAFPGDGIESRIERESELRLVINATFDFPPIMGVHFRNSVYTERLGVIPRPTDVYNLIPWTWLIDWFSGVGNYIEVIDNINRDPVLINWGMLTCETKGKLITNFQSSSYRSDRAYADNVEVLNVDIWTKNKHTSIYEYECQTRSDVAQILDVKTLSEPSSLTTYQKSILGALLAQRTNFTRSKAFKPRS